MKSNKVVKVISFTLVGLFILFLVLSASIPVLTLVNSTSSSSTTIKLHFFDFFGQVSVSSSSTSVSNAGYFYGIITLSISMLGALFVCFDNKVLRSIGISFLVSVFAFYVYCFAEIKITADMLSTGSSSVKVSTSGSSLLLITAILALLICLTALVEFLLPYLSNLIKPRQSLEERLQEIASLKEKGLISEEEANTLRQEALK